MLMKLVELPLHVTVGVLLHFMSALRLILRAVLVTTCSMFERGVCL